VLLLVLVLSGCSLRNVNRATLAASTAGLACDWAQTRSTAAGGWVNHHETNPMLGARPTTAQVDTYFVVAAIANTFVWLVMPQKLRSVVPAGVFAVQVDSVQHNRRVLDNVCGFE
jgi:hypothetical protein